MYSERTMADTTRRRVVSILLVVAVLSVTGLLAPKPVRAATVYVNGTISSNETWMSDSVYVINGDLTIAAGVTLTIPAGTIVKFQYQAPNESTRFLLVHGTLDLQGTAIDPVVFTSERDDTYGGDTNGDGFATLPAKGDWGNILFTETSVNNIFEHAIVRYGGRHTGNDSMIWTADASPTIQHNRIEYAYDLAISYNAKASDLASITGNTITFSNRGIRASSNGSGVVQDNVITHGSGDGVYLANFTSATVSGNTVSDMESGIVCDGTSPVISNNTVSDNNSYPFKQINNAFPAYSGNTVTGNTYQAIAVYGTLGDGLPFNTDGTWFDVQGFPYVVVDNITIQAGDKLVIPAGTIVKFQYDPVSRRRLIVNGTLDLQGTAIDPVVFTSERDDTYGGDTNGDGFATLPAAGDWGYIQFTNTSVDNAFEYAMVRYGGGNPFGYYAIWVDRAEIDIQYTLIEYSYNDGLYIYRSDTDPAVTVQYCTFRLNNGSGVRVVSP